MKEFYTQRRMLKATMKIKRKINLTKQVDKQVSAGKNQTVHKQQTGRIYHIHFKSNYLTK
jgi:hypothetical protein